MFLYVLALAVFAQGISEFMVPGLVPGIAHGLSVSVGTAASLTSAYAVGMIIGAPVMAMWSARWPRRLALTAFLTGFAVVHVVGAITLNFAVLLVTRIVAAMFNAGFLAVAMSVAPSLIVPAKHARGTAVLLSGVTLSCVVGVPAGAFLQTWWGWRSAFLAVAVACLPAMVLTFSQAPADVTRPHDVSVRREVRALLVPRVRSALLLGALVNGATFASFAYLAVMAPQLPETAISGLLAAFGVGAFAGVTTAGRVGSGRMQCGLVFALCVLPVGWALLAVISSCTVALFVVTVLQGGLSFGAGSALVNRIIHLAPEAPSLAGAFATVALNVGAFAGPLLAGFVTQVTDGYSAAAWVSTAMAAVAVVIVVGASR